MISRTWHHLLTIPYNDYFFNLFFFGVPYLATCIFLFFYNEPELGVEIYPDMALTPLPSSIGWGSNPRPSDCEPSALPLDHSFHFTHRGTRGQFHQPYTSRFYAHDPKSAKETVKSSTLLRPMSVKASRKMLMKLTPG